MDLCPRELPLTTVTGHRCCRAAHSWQPGSGGELGKTLPAAGGAAQLPPPRPRWWFRHGGWPCLGVVHFIYFMDVHGA